MVDNPMKQFHHHNLIHMAQQLLESLEKPHS